MATKILTIDSPIVLNPNDVTVDSSSIPSGSIAISKNTISANINGEITEFNASKYLSFDNNFCKSDSIEGTDRLDIELTDDGIDVLWDAFKNAYANHNYLEVKFNLLTPNILFNYSFLLQYILRFHSFSVSEGANGTDLNTLLAHCIVQNYTEDTLVIYECYLSINISAKKQQKSGTLSFIKKPVIQECIFTIDGENENNVETGDSLVLHGDMTSSYNRQKDAILKLSQTSGSGMFNNLRVFMYGSDTRIWRGTLIKDNDLYLAYIDFGVSVFDYSLKLERLKKSSEDVILGYMAIGLQDTASLRSFYFSGNDRKNSTVIASTTSSTFPGKGTGYFDIDLTDAMTREEYDKISYMTAQVSLIENVYNADYVDYHIQVNKAKSSTRYGIKVLILNNNLTAYSSIPAYGGCVITFYK